MASRRKAKDAKKADREAKAQEIKDYLAAKTEKALVPELTTIEFGPNKPTDAEFAQRLAESGLDIPATKNLRKTKEK